MTCKTKPAEDDRSPVDGFLLGGYRKIRKDGVVTFNRAKWQNDALKKWEGLYIYVETEDHLCRSLMAKPKGPLRGPEIECKEIGI